MFSHAQSLLIQRFLSVLGVFGKYFVFTKTEKFQKQCCPVLATQSRVIQVACYSRELAGWFWRLVRKWKVQSRGVHRDFHVLAHDSLTSETSSHKKHLANFFQIFRLELFWQVTLATYWRLVSVAKNKCFAFQRQFFPWIFVTVHCLPHFSLNRNWPKHSSNSISASFLLKSSRKRYGFYLSHFIFYVLSVLFLILWVCCCHYAF